jgi:hypothetical protein
MERIRRSEGETPNRGKNLKATSKTFIITESGSIN